MESRWSDEEAREAIARYAQGGANEDLALRVYTTRLLGQDPRLVLHGGGNTSVKSRVRDVTGEEVAVLFVKGSGWDMGSIEPAGLPALLLEPLRELARLRHLSDREMVNLLRRNLLDSSAPNPSVETLLHAWVPHKFVDHTHANAVVALTDQPEGEAICRELYGERLAIVPYVMPGFELAVKAKAVADAHPEAEGLILHKHGIFSFGATAREAYERMIEAVSLAEARIGEARPVRVFVPGPLPDAVADPASVAPILRGRLAIEEDAGQGEYRRWILDFRTGPEVLAFVNGAELERYSQRGTATPDHVIRTKPWPLVLPAPERGRLDRWRPEVETGLKRYEQRYRAYFDAGNRRHGGTKRPLDPKPRLVLVPGVGLFAAGKDAASARVAADLAEATIEVIAAAESMSRFQPLSEEDLFEVEYWSLEQAKLGRGGEKRLARHVVAVTGGAGTIGRATAAAFRAEGAEVALLDLPGERLDAAAAEMQALAVACDVTDDGSVREAFQTVCRAFGGLDVLVSNAGAAWEGRIGEVSTELLSKSFELNFFGHQRVARAAIEIFRAQGTGGVLLFNASKQAVNPGPGFGPYGLPKAATLFLTRQYALDHGREGVRSNAVNADRIRSGILTDEMVAARARARGVSEQEYLKGNLLGREVRPEDVAQAFVFLALARSTTGAALTVDGGNIAAALR